MDGLIQVGPKLGTRHDRAFVLAAGVNETGISRVAVIGAGAMGAGIAAQAANAGVLVDLFDVRGSDADPNAPARLGIEYQVAHNGFMHENVTAMVRPRNIDDHLNCVADADWIIEAVPERLDIKKALYARIDGVLKHNAIVSSNTSTILRADLVAGLPLGLAQRFFITHFFNPPRLMPLAEVVVSAENDPLLAAKVVHACDMILGKTVVHCRDTPGFIANRIGCYWIASGVLQARRMGIPPERADAAMAALGVPRSGVFGLLDLIGLDLVPQIWGRLMASLPASDGIQNYDLPGDDTLRALVKSGRFGRKTKAGFFRLNERRQLEAFNLSTGNYRATIPVDPESIPEEGQNLSALLDGECELSVYGRRVLCDVVAYAADKADEIAGGNIGIIDAAMMLGYGWRQGPFRLADQLGLRRIAGWLDDFSVPIPAQVHTALKSGGFYAPKKTVAAATPPHSVSELRPVRNCLLANDTAGLWDLGDGVACFSIHPGCGALTPQVFDALESSLELAGRFYQALVLGNEDSSTFSAHADLLTIQNCIAERRQAELRAYVRRGQQIFRRLRFSSVPVVAAMQGIAPGGGCQLALSAGRIVAHAELNAGLSEVLVGLVPGWGGCTQLLVNAQSAQPDRDPVALVEGVFNTIFGGRRSRSALDAHASGILRRTDRIVMNRSGLLSVAKMEALLLLEQETVPPKEVQLVLPGTLGREAIMTRVLREHASGRLTDADVVLADGLASVLTGGAYAEPMRQVREAELLDLELEAFIGLVEQETMVARLSDMLARATGLRN